MSELESSTWEEVVVDGQPIEMEIRPESGQYQVGQRYGSEDNRGYVVLLTDGKVTYYNRPVNPRSTARSPSGHAAIADWRAYGESTGSEITVRKEDGTVVYQTELDQSSPYVALSDDGTYLAIAPYDGTTRVVDITTGNLIVLHSNRLDERQKPLFLNEPPELHLAQNEGDTPEYGISLEDELVWESDEFGTHDFIKALSLEAGIDWEETLQRLFRVYQEEEGMRRGVIETLADASLANVDSSTTLRTIIDELERLYNVMIDEDHKRAAAVMLADAYYRLARNHKQNHQREQVLEAIGTSIDYAVEGLPWYDAKQILANCYRFRARFHKQRGNRQEALTDIKKLFDLESEYNIQIVREADKNLQKELSN